MYITLSLCRHCEFFTAFSSVFPARCLLLSHEYDIVVLMLRCKYDKVFQCIRQGGIYLQFTSHLVKYY